METKQILISIFLMAFITYLCRIVTMLLFKREFKNKFINSFLYYIPYSLLAVMVFPKIIFSTGTITSGLVGTGVALILAFFRRSLLIVALSAVASVFIVQLIF